VAKKAITSEKIQLKRVRLAFANLDVPEYFKPNNPQPNEVKKYRATLLLDPSNAEHKAACKILWAQGDDIAAKFWTGGVPNKLDKCFGTNADLRKIYDGFKDMVHVKVSSKDPVPMVGRRRNGPVDPRTGKPTFLPVKPGDADFPYNGCYVNATVTLWTQDSHSRVGINGNLLALQFCEDGQAFGRQSANPDSEFEALEDGEAGAGGAQGGTGMWD
jgi:hypothetical protein